MQVNGAEKESGSPLFAESTDLESLLGAGLSEDVDIRKDRPPGVGRQTKRRGVLRD